MSENIFALCESITESKALKLNCEKYKSQLKYDGCRCMAYVDYNGEVVLFNRTINPITHKFKEIAKEFSLFCECIIDGEIISSDGNFNTLQTRANLSNQNKIDNSKVECYFMAFDILKVGEEDLTMKPLSERYKILCDLIKPMQFKLIKIAEMGEINNTLNKAKENKGEGIVIKNINSCYERRRSKNWLKCKFKIKRFIKFNQYTINNAGIRLSNNKGDAIQMAQQNQIKPIINSIDKNGFIECEVECLEISGDKMRFPSFKRVVC